MQSLSAFSMLGYILQIVAVYSISWGVWRIFRVKFVKSPFDRIPGPPWKSFLTGHFPLLFAPNAWDFHNQIANQYGAVIKVKGLLGENILYVFDPKAMHHIFVKDQYTYEELSSVVMGNEKIFGTGLVSTMGSHHRKQRKMLNPVFSTVHMREMILPLYQVTYKLRDAFLRKVRNDPQEIDVLSWMTRTALESIGQSVLGYSFDTLTEDNVEHPYSTSVRLLVPVAAKFRLIRLYLFTTLVKIGTPRFQRFVIGILPWKSLHQLRDIVDVMHNTSVEIFESKKQAIQDGVETLENTPGQGKDIMSILMKANMNAAKEDKLADAEVTGQMTTFTFAGMDTTSSALSRILHLLSEHQDVQDKLRQEIREARKEHGDMAYDELVALPYLDAVCRETLRLYPPVPYVLRIARKDIVLPIGNPSQGADDAKIEEIIVPRDTKILISILSANRNPAIWGSDSYEWKPERWLSPLPETLTNAHVPGIYSHLMTFIGGGRACIGFKFSELEMKVVLCLLLESFRFSPPENKPVNWHMNGIVAPSLVDDKSSKPQLPMLVSVAE